MYAMVGKGTKKNMSKMNFLSGFSWKWGFLGTQSHSQQNSNGYKTKEAKSIEKNLCPGNTHAPESHQWRLAVCKASPLQLSPMMVPDEIPMLFTPGIARSAHMTEVHWDNRSSRETPPSYIILGIAPKRTIVHNDGYLHCASPIQGLPPEEILDHQQLVLSKTMGLLAECHHITNIQNNRTIVPLSVRYNDKETGTTEAHHQVTVSTLYWQFTPSPPYQHR